MAASHVSENTLYKRNEISFIPPVQYLERIHFFLSQKTYKRNFEQSRIRACKQLRKFCEHEQTSTSLNFARKSSKGQILRALENFKGPFDTPTIPKARYFRLTSFFLLIVLRPTSSKGNSYGGQKRENA